VTLSIVGIDPGLTGAIAILGDDNTLVCHTMPIFEPEKARRTINEAEVIGIFRSHNIRHVFIELVGGGMTGKKQGGNTMFNFGEGYGILKGITAALQIPRSFVPPAVWKRYFRLLKTDKEASRARASEIFPYYTDQWAKIVKNSKKGIEGITTDQAGGRAEAALIAIYGRMKLSGEIP
jgi:crossover junction endodeoxyribonuclease RuvC